MLSKKSLASVLVFVMTCEALPETRRSDIQQGPSTRILDFISMFNGVYSNKKEVEDEIETKYKVVEDTVTVTMLPVQVPALAPALTVYFEESDNGQVYRMEILVISEDEDGIIIIVPRNFTDPSHHRPNTFNPTALHNLTESDFEVPPEECNLEFMQLEKDVFMGSWPDCESKDPLGKHPIYVMTITCHTFSVMSSSGFSREQSSRIPYKHIKTRSYPLLPYMLDGAYGYQDPCGTTSN